MSSQDDDLSTHQELHDLPLPLSAMVVGAPTNLNGFEAGCSPRLPETLRQSNPGDPFGQVRYTAPNREDGVCGAPSVAADQAASPLSQSIVPARPLPPGAPPAPQPAMQAVPRPAKPTDQTLTETVIVHRGTPHPFKPKSPEQIAAFATLWADPGYTVDKLAKEYRCSDFAIHDWRKGFGLPEKRAAVKAAAEASKTTNAAGLMIDAVKAAAVITGAMATAGQARQGPGLGNSPIKGFDPMEDPEIKAGYDAILAEARAITGHSDLTVLQRKVMKLSIILATKTPVNSFASAQVTMDYLSRALLSARKVEANMPASAADPVLLRKEAAFQLMNELKSVLNPEDQQALAILVKRGADVLLARGREKSVVPNDMGNDLPGASSQHNGKDRPQPPPPFPG